MEKKFKRELIKKVMKNLLKISIGLVLMGSLTSCVIYPDNYSGNEQYYDPYYQGGSKDLRSEKRLLL